MEVNNIKIVFHLSDNKYTLNHLKYWSQILQPYLKNIVFLVRKDTIYKKILENLDEDNLINIYYAKSPIDVENFIYQYKNLKVVFYTANTIKNIHTIRFIHLSHIFIGSKNTDRKIKFNKSFRAYDEIWFSSKFLQDKFENLIPKSHLKFKIIGKQHLKDKEILENIENNVLIFSKKNRLFNFILKTKKIIKQKYQKIYFYFNTKKPIYKLKSKLFLSDIELFRDKNLFQEYLDKVELLIIDEKDFDFEYLVYNVPIIIYGNPQNISEKLTDIVYSFNSTDELIYILETISQNQSYNSEILEYFLGMKELKKNTLFSSIDHYLE